MRSLVLAAVARARRETQVILLGRRAKNVSIEGKTIPRSPSFLQLRGQRRGWMVNAASFPGVVLKLAPRAGISRVTVEY